MAGIRFSAVTGEVATGTSTKTILQILAAANHQVLVDEIAVSFQGTSATDAPILVEVLRQNSAGTMTSLTPKKVHDGDDESLQVSAQHSATAEPTAGDVLLAQLVHPQSGYTWQAPFARQIKVKGGSRLGVRVTAGVGVDCVCRMFGEE
jgi:hypothetical protein